MRSCRLAVEGSKVTDPAALKRIQYRTERIKAASGRVVQLRHQGHPSICGCRSTRMVSGS